MLRAALALNNTGVTLLERGRPEDAVKTFTDSILTMKNALLLIDEAHLGPGTISLRAVDCLIHSADARLAQKFPPQQFNHNATRLAVSVYPIDNDLDGMTAALKLRTTASWCMSPVRFRESPLSDSDESDIDLVAATIMYNKGLAHVHAATSSSSKATKEKKHLGLAATSFSISHSMLTNHLESSQGIVLSEFWNLQLNALVLTNLKLVYQYQGHAQHSQCVSECLKEVLDSIQQYHARFVSIQFAVGNHALASAA